MTLPQNVKFCLSTSCAVVLGGLGRRLPAWTSEGTKGTTRRIVVGWLSRRLRSSIPKATKGRDVASYKLDHRLRSWTSKASKSTHAATDNIPPCSTASVVGTTLLSKQFLRRHHTDTRNSTPNSSITAFHFQTTRRAARSSCSNPRISLQLGCQAVLLLLLLLPLLSSPPAADNDIARKKRSCSESIDEWQPFLPAQGFELLATTFKRGSVFVVEVDYGCFVACCQASGVVVRRHVLRRSLFWWCETGGLV
jgi:hypothetical protein